MSETFGFVEWFRPGDHDRVATVLPGIAASGARWLRTHVSWADYHAEGGAEWYDWLLPRLAEEFEVLPCVHYTPPSLSRTGRSSGAPRVLKDYADFIDMLLTRHGRHFTHVELWNEPNNLLDWDWREDTDFALFAEMVAGAAHWVQQRGWKTVLGGPAPFDAYWLNLMGERGLLAKMDAVGMHGFPGTWDSEEGSWRGWPANLAEMRAILDRYNPQAEMWITETGYSTWRRDEMAQARRFVEALDAGADRLYWYAWRDLPEHVAVQEGLWFDPRHYHLGVVDATNRPKLLARFLTQGGVPRVREAIRLAAPRIGGRARPVVITGGSGFIGANLADSYLSDGREVVIYDNLSRPGVERNLHWLSTRHGARVHAASDDLRDEQALRTAVADAEAVFHLAAQTAVTTSLEQPIDDFEVNARGTLNLLEALRATGRKVPVVFASTNKVYGALDDIKVEQTADACRPVEASFDRGVDERRPLDFCTPYGCSKGVADQYVLDYAKSYGLPAAVLRMSCIYGPRQFGTEDQGWVAHFLIRALEERPITVFGTGRQVRDVLDVSDAIAAYRLLMARIGVLSGRAFNLGGGPANAVSLRQVLREIETVTGRAPQVTQADWRQGDQPWFVADTRRLTRATGWTAKVGWRRGLRGLAHWLAEDRGLDLLPERQTA
ncbi:NAD-dependent epimerase/dehydratase family protein [Rhodobacteraceae bacterium 2CG4]|uniref:NAD-dependent epimerase/dehydratase family protein n=1 Tax=Halovulum marinum TaxID=2662447 RepID=A0A6L5YYU6_9RHOB|nr:NAD-dependent epimerase/dehydratase family protein [Halovulum marinum]MSU89209.1 NAD-dependent epimerase/dehydratase family protein [Halovulum marinum]